MAILKMAYDTTVVQLFEKQVNKTPALIAIKCESHELSYQALNEKANQFAYWIQQQEIKPGDFVGVLLEPGLDFIVSILGIIKAGGVYLPLDALAPHQRLTDIITDAAPKMVLTSEQYAHHFKEHEQIVCLIKSVHLGAVSCSKENLIPQITPRSPLYMMYTSGSTGTPKGVIIPHRAVVNLVKVENYAEVSQGNKVAQFNNLAFDASTFEIWGALLRGATLVIVEMSVRNDHVKLKEVLKQNEVKYLLLTTAFFHQLIKSEKSTLDSIEVIIFGGEQINTALLKTFIAYRRDRNYPITLINGYGPTEGTTFTCNQTINEKSNFSDDELSSIGKAIKHVKTYVLNEDLEPCDEGELYVSGVNLAIGYHGCPKQNNEKFTDNPFFQEEPFERLYKTGDKVRILPSGDLLYLGRIDDQVKIGGFRIHLNEIENQLMRHPSIGLAAVKVEIGGGDHQMLTAYLVLSKGDKINADEVRSFLGKILPPYMLPAKYCLVSEFPLTRIGKIDKAKLDQIPHVDLSYHMDSSSSCHIEETIKNTWMLLLNRKAIDVHKNLFELGANSLLMTEACVRINQELKSELQVSSLIAYPTIHKLTRYLEGDIDKVEAHEVRKSGLSQDIAIIGMSCRFPKADSIQAFWDNLCLGNTCLTRFSEEVKNVPYVPVRGVLSDIDHFDANFFGFNPVDASVTDPQQRVFLECAWEALEHAGVVPSQMGVKRISVFAGMTDSTYLHENLLNNSWVYKEQNRFAKRLASSMGTLSTQVSYRLDLKGRSLNINTACSTGLVTVAQACQELMSGSSDVALAGAVSIVVPQEAGYLYQEGGIESSDGVCRPFDKDANGTVFSNGAGVVILKRLEDAIAENDTIYAVIKGIGINNDGADKLGFTAPSTHGQMACIREALAHAKIQADEIGYVEAHGTATALGDVVEVEALSTVYTEQTEKKQFCVLGSVKGNIGHTDVAAGIAGLIKTVLCLYHEKLPPTAHFNSPNPKINFETSPFFVNQQCIDWKSGKKPRYAGVSSFGVGGTNAHCILSDHQQKYALSSNWNEHLFILSAKSESALLDARKKWDAYLSDEVQKKENGHLSDIAYTLQTGREPFLWRCFGVGPTSEEIKKSLLQNKLNRCDEEYQQNVIFMFPGQGMQYHQMAAELMRELPFFSSWVHQGIAIAKHHLHVDLLEVLNASDERLQQTQYAQPLLFIIEYALAQLLMHYGVRPSGLIGHSLGEYVAACLAGVFSFEDGVALVCQRGLLMASAPTGEMLAIACSAEQFSIYATEAELAIHNSAQHCVASGSANAIRTLEAEVLKAGLTCKKLKVNHAFHSRLMEPLEHAFKELFANISLSAPQISIISNVTGGWLSTQEATSPDYWYQHLRHTVQFCRGLNTILTDEHPFFIEVGPGQSLISFLREVAKVSAKSINMTHVLPTHHRQKTDINQFLTSLGHIWQVGIPVEWSRMYEDERRTHVPLPTYAFQKQRYWIEPDSEFKPQEDAKPKMYRPVWSHQPGYLHSVQIESNELHAHDWIIIKDDFGMSERFISELEEQHLKPIIVTFGERYFQADAKHFEINPAEKKHFFDLFHVLKPFLKHPIILHAAAYSKLKEDLSSLESIETQLTKGFYSLLYLTQAYVELIGDQQPLKVGILTGSTQHVLGTELINPAQATLIGPARVIPQEHPLLKFKLFDLNPTEHPEQNENLINKIIHVCINETWDEASLINAYRNGYEWHLSYAPVVSTTKMNKRLQDKGIYLFTGGTGGIALSCCEAIAKTVSAPTFLLLSRTKFPSETTWDRIIQDKTHPFFDKVSKVRAIQALGGKCYFYQVDISDLSALQKVIDSCKKHFGQVDGVVHCAGVAGEGFAQFKSKEIIKKVFSPKIDGTYNLACVLNGASIDFVILMSSLAVQMGGLQQMDYSGANAYLDASVQNSSYYPFSSFVASINWNTWRDVGIAAEAAKRGEPTFLGKGNDISPQQGQDLFLQVLQGIASQVLISNQDMNKCAISNQSHAVSALQNVKIARDDLNVEVKYSAPMSAIELKLVQLWQDILGIDGIGVNDDFFALGGHSLKALGLIEKMNELFACRFSAAHLYRTPTIKTLAEAIGESTNVQLDILVPLKVVKGHVPTLFLCHPVSGLIYGFQSFASHSEIPLSIYALQDPSIQTGKMLYTSLHDMARAYLDAIKKIQPQGPYFLAGYSFGGNVFYEVANLLQKQGEEIGLLAMIDSWAMTSFQQKDEQHFKKRLAAQHSELSEEIVLLAWERDLLLQAYSPSKISQNMILFKAAELIDDYELIEHPTNGWSSYNSGQIICHKIEGNHDTIMNDGNVIKMWHYLKNYIARNM